MARLRPKFYGGYLNTVNANDTYHITQAICPGRQLGAASSRAQGAMDLPLAL